MSLKYEENKLKIICPKCKNETFNEDSTTISMIRAGKLMRTLPPSTVYICSKCNTIIGNPYKKLPTEKELKIIENTFTFLFDDDIDLKGSGDAKIVMNINNKDLRQLQKNFLRFYES